MIISSFLSSTLGLFEKETKQNNSGHISTFFIVYCLTTLVLIRFVRHFEIQLKYHRIFFCFVLFFPTQILSLEIDDIRS